MSCAEPHSPSPFRVEHPHFPERSFNRTIYDAHAHIFPEKIAEKACINIGKFYSVPMYAVGSSEILLASCAAAGIARTLVCSVATKPEQVTAINDFIHREFLRHPQFMGLAAMHPHFADYAAELDRVVSLGFRGVKFHSDFQEFNMDDPAFFPMFEAIAEHNLPVLFHMGDAHLDYSHPRRLANLMRAVPNLTCIAAHFGGYQKWDAAMELLDFNSERLYFDTSSTLAFLPGERAVKMIRTLGADHFLFGSDFPMWDQAEEIDRFLTLELTDEEQEKIFHRNFERLFQLV